MKTFPPFGTSATSACSFAPSSKALVTNSFLLLLVRHLLLVAMHLFLVVRPEATSSLLAPSSDALCFFSFSFLLYLSSFPSCLWFLHFSASLCSFSCFLVSLLLCFSGLCGSPPVFLLRFSAHLADAKKAAKEEAKKQARKEAEKQKGNSLEKSRNRKRNFVSIPY